MDLEMFLGVAYFADRIKICKQSYVSCICIHLRLYIESTFFAIFCDNIMKNGPLLIPYMEKSTSEVTSFFWFLLLVKT